MKTDFDLIRAHEFCTGHRAQLQQDQICGCFYCLRLFHPREITEWIDEPGGTALCPHCGIDAVIGESSRLPMTKDFLRRMHQYWFTESE
ncbi:MAG: cytoplasmic protein [Clostridiales bacterium]|nr:cytoplasmic protein [Clostridiales bacterium]